MAKKFARLTRDAMRRLSANGTITEHGISFERLPDGDGRFTVNIMVDGQRIHRVVGKESDGTTLSVRTIFDGSGITLFDGPWSRGTDVLSWETGVV